MNKISLEENKKSTTISPTLSNLIAEANYTLENAKDKILAVYNYAVQTDGYKPEQAKKLVEEKIVNVSKRYIREILPLESKQTEKTKKSLKSNEEQVPHPNHNVDLEKFREEKGTRTLPTAYEVKEASIRFREAWIDYVEKEES